MRIFALEYIREIIHSNNIHFVATKKKSQFQIKTQVGPFICNNRATREEAELLLKQMNFPLSFTWSYDPMGVISELRVENNFTTYHNTARPGIEQYKNQLEWKENTLKESEEWEFSTSNVRTPLAQEKTTKREREEQPSPTTEA